MYTLQVKSAKLNFRQPFLQLRDNSEIIMLTWSSVIINYYSCSIIYNGSCGKQFLLLNEFYDEFKAFYF